MKPDREAIFPAGRRALYDKHRYSAAIRSGDILFVSGQVGAREDGSPEPDFKKQVELALERLQAVLDAAGSGFDDVLDVAMFFTNPEAQAKTVIAAYQKAFDRTPYPALTAVGVTYLAGFDFEIKVIARARRGAE